MPDVSSRRPNKRKRIALDKVNPYLKRGYSLGFLLRNKFSKIVFSQTGKKGSLSYQ
jgi:hypothetical protein